MYHQASQNKYIPNPSGDQRWAGPIAQESRNQYVSGEIWRDWLPH